MKGSLRMPSCLQCCPCPLRMSSTARASPQQPLMSQQQQSNNWRAHTPRLLQSFLHLRKLTGISAPSRAHHKPLQAAGLWEQDPVPWTWMLILWAQQSGLAGKARMHPLPNQQRKGPLAGLRAGAVRGRAQLISTSSSVTCQLLALHRREPFLQHSRARSPLMMFL